MSEKRVRTRGAYHPEAWDESTRSWVSINDNEPLENRPAAEKVIRKYAQNIVRPVEFRVACVVKTYNVREKVRFELVSDDPVTVQKELELGSSEVSSAAPEQAVNEPQTSEVTPETNVWTSPPEYEEDVSEGEAEELEAAQKVSLPLDTDIPSF